MKQAIVIATTPKRYDFLQNLLSSIDGYDTYPIVILSDYTYFAGKIRHIAFETQIEEFTMIPDSLEIKDPSMFDILFKQHKGKSVSFWKSTRRDFYMGMGKFLSESLRKIDISYTASTMREDEVFARNLGERYSTAEIQVAYLLPDGAEEESGLYMDKFGRKNMVVENDYFIKYKAHWSWEMLPDKPTKR
jgi:hypothetical protein